MKQVAQQILNYAVKAAGEGKTKSLQTAFPCPLKPTLVKCRQEINSSICTIFDFFYFIIAGVPELSKEASDIFIWCLTQNPECYKQWVSNFCSI